jgi:hypothetical protein
MLSSPSLPVVVELTGRGPVVGVSDELDGAQNTPHPTSLPGPALHAGAWVLRSLQANPTATLAHPSSVSAVRYLSVVFVD